MFDVALLLGPVAFRSLEIPQTINFGGAQRLAVHRLLGGQRVIDALGRDDADILFSGTFSGTDATLRARLLDELRVLGAPVPLTWDVFFYTVQISQFEAEYQNPAWVPYKLRCSVIRDEASAALLTPLSLASNVLADAATAVSMAGSGGFDLTQAQAAAVAPDATVRGTAAYVSAQSAVTSSAGSLDQAISGSGQSLEAAFPSAITSAAQGVTSLSTATVAAGQLASLSAARGYLVRLATNLTNAST